MKKFLAVILFSLTAIAASAQVGIGGAPAANFATSISQCPTVTSGYFLCVVVPGGTAQPFLALSVAGWNSGAPFAVVPPPQTTLPVVQTVNGKKPDAAGNVAISASTTSSTTIQ